MFDSDGALPVRLAVDARLATQVVPHLEGTLGWQVTQSDELPAALAVVGVDGGTVTDLPAVLLVRDDDPPDRAARAATTATTVLRWPDERDRLPQVAAQLLQPFNHTRIGAATVRFGGAAGGVGTTTVTLALGGLLAWQGVPTLVVVSGDVPVADVARIDAGALSAHRAWDAATRVAGVANLRVLAVSDGPRPATRVPDGTLVLRDDGVTGDADVLVCARDRAGAAATDATTAGAVVVVGRGPLTADAWTRATRTSAHQIHLAWSQRVARAGLLQRVPASVPGRWLAALRPLARSLMG